MSVYWDVVAGIGLGVALGNLLTIGGLFAWAALACWIASNRKRRNHLG